MPTTLPPRRLVALAGLTLPLAAMLLAGCDKGGSAPTGQVVATVNGEEITRRDVGAELTAAKVGANVDLKKVQPLVVDQIVNRKLLVEEAKRQGLDKTPEYIAAEIRAREGILASQLVEQWASKQTPPSQSQVDAFIADNPQMFAARRILLVDQIRTDATGITPQALRPFQTNDAVAGYLTQTKHPFERGRTTIDTVNIPADTMAQITKLAPGEPFVVVSGGAMTVSALVGERPAPLPEAQRTAVAKGVMARQAAQTGLTNQLNSLKSTAKIAYQPGFAPPAAAAKPKP